ncbi:phosphodiesterase [Thalassococcus lentus]|uniref:Phosphodiesterase n=1 Tax=Thalassococcus lentus TaxID=1210524 RepID=A0ABT4XWZ1_9RHOB|nr:phosphodiesterase [Thalassococcus lentus]MDA7426328.1 phosphodiesterase [Thalassococcus lentus]
MTAILQISDTHIVHEGALVSGRLDTADALGRLVERISGIRDKIGAIDALLVTGDLSDGGTAASYDRFKSIIAPLGLPTYVIAGNHDAREPMRAAFAQDLPASGHLDWSRRVGDIHLIGLDTLVEGQGAGALSSDSLSFLQAALAQAGGAPVLLALHHPPFASGIRFMDKIGLTNREAFREIIADYKGTLRIVCGHVHCMMVTDVAGHIALSAPSPCSTFAYDRRSDAPVGFYTQEDGCLLHRWNGGFESIRIGPVAGPGPFPF